MTSRDLVNLPLLLISLGVLIGGYLMLGKGPVDSVESMTVAPLILVGVYIVLLPLSVLLHKKNQ